MPSADPTPAARIADEIAPAAAVRKLAGECDWLFLDTAPAMMNQVELAVEAAERAAMTFAAADADAVRAAQAAASSAEAIRLRESGNGDPKQRGPNCRQRETEEQTERDTLATILANKSATDRAAKLEKDAEAIRARLREAPRRSRR